MGTIISALDIARGALDADQTALNVTANNVANQNTPGYTREVVNFATQDTVLLNGYALAGGVQLNPTTSVRDRVLEQRVEQQAQVSAQSAAVESGLNEIQSIFGLSASSSSESLTVLGTSVNAFFSSLTALAADPSDTATRQQVLSAAQTLVTTFNSTASQLTSITSGLNNEALASAGSANALLSTIASLNEQIATESPNADAGVLEDQRQVAIAQLSQYVGLDQITTSDNGIELTTSNDALLVAGGTSYALDASISNGAVQVLAGPGGQDITAGLTGGSLGGALQVLTASLPQITGEIDALANAIATSVNTQNEAGVDSTGTPGVALFTIGATVAGSAAAIGVATSDPSLVAAAATGEGTSGNTNATALANLATATIVAGQTVTSYLSSTLSGIGNAASLATNDAAVQQATLTQLTTQRDSLSGVSLDEEASNLTEYQRSYQAASQLFSIIDTLLVSSINLGVQTSVS